MLAGLRPSVERRFTGDSTKVEFESHLRSFQRAMKIEGINDSIRVTEMSHWFTGDAGEICGLYCFHEDSSEQYRLMIGELKKYYGRRIITTEAMLEDS